MTQQYVDYLQTDTVIIEDPKKDSYLIFNCKAREPVNIKSYDLLK